MRTHSSLEQIILDRSMPEPNTGCWIWLKGLMPAGYGCFGYKGKTVLAHRISYEVAKGPIPKGLQIDHICRVRCCVNPDHLRCVTIRENVLCGIGVAAQNLAKTHCRRGHEYTPDNTFSIPSNPRGRRCRECNRIDNMEWKERTRKVPKRLFQPRGEESPFSKLSAEGVLEIRELVKGGYTQREIACRYGISQSRVSHIITGKAWS